MSFSCSPFCGTPTLLQPISFTSNSVRNILHFPKCLLKTPRECSSTYWIQLLRYMSGKKTWWRQKERGRKAFPVEKKWGSPITQDTTCRVTALSHYGLLMRLSLEKLPSLPLLWWIFFWLLNVKMANSPFLLDSRLTTTSEIRRWCFTCFLLCNSHIESHVLPC